MAFKLMKKETATTAIAIRAVLGRNGSCIIPPG
jgi:hypothetical protein